MKSFYAWARRLFFKYAMAGSHALFGREVVIEGLPQKVKILPFVWKGRLHLMGLHPDQIVKVEFVSAFTTRLVAGRNYEPARPVAAALPPNLRVAHVMLGHITQPKIEALLEHAQTMGPSYELILAYGGKREEFDKIGFAQKVYLDDPSLRGPLYQQSYNQVLLSVKAHYAGRTPPDWVFLADYDTVPLQRNYLQTSIATAYEWRASFISKWLRDVTYSNHFSLTPATRDRVIGLFSENPTNSDIRVYHSLGCAFLMTWDCLCDIVKLQESFSKTYFELVLPTAAAAAGHPIRAMEACGKEWTHVRWLPVHDVSELEQLQADGFPLAHPVKDIDGFIAIAPVLQKRAGPPARV